MKMIKILPTITLLLLPPQSVTGQTLLPREEAARQIKIALSNDPVKTHFYLELAYNDPQLRAKLLRMITGPDMSFGETQTQYSLNGALFADLHFLWRSGAIDHFDTGADNIPHAVLKEDFKWLCTPELENNPGHNEKILGCNVTIAERLIVSVTGISSAYEEGRELKIAEFGEKYQPTKAGQFLAAQPGFPTGSFANVLTGQAIQPARAIFLLYDDGWRLVKILDSRHLF